jgi:N-methylhydantoinase B
MMNPEFPAAVGMRSASIIRAQDATLGCLMKAIPQKVPACPSGHATIMVVSLQDPQTGKRFVNVIEPMIGGGGASFYHDGTDAAGGFLTFLANTPVESNEADVPILILRYELIQDSGGPGQYRGGLGARLDFLISHPNTIVTARNRERSKFRPWGAQGGKAASLSRFVINPGTPHERELKNIDVVKVEPGDIVSIWSPGGGGYGSPFKRNPEAVLRDVQAGYISRSAATDEYGVVICENKIDLNATEKLRDLKKKDEKFTEFDFGPEREAYESIWSDSVYETLTNILLELPTPLRSFAKREIYREICLSATQKEIKPDVVMTAWNNIKVKNGLD